MLIGFNMTSLLFMIWTAITAKSLTQRSRPHCTLHIEQKLYPRKLTVQNKRQCFNKDRARGSTGKQENKPTIKIHQRTQNNLRSSESPAPCTENRTLLNTRKSLGINRVYIFQLVNKDSITPLRATLAFVYMPVHERDRQTNAWHNFFAEILISKTLLFYTYIFWSACFNVTLHRLGHVRLPFDTIYNTEQICCLVINKGWHNIHLPIKSKGDFENISLVYYLLSWYYVN